MGWTEYVASCYKNGRVDRKAECDKLFDSDNYKVLKSTLKGSVWYGAIQYKNDKVFGMVILTSVRKRYLFAYKDMDETMGPYNYDCPKSILDLLSPTDNEWANEWRQKCLNKMVETHSLAKLPVGSIIEFTLPFDTTYNSKGQVIKLEKVKYGSRQAYWSQGWCRWTRGLMKTIENNCEIKILKEGC